MLRRVLIQFQLTEIDDPCFLYISLLQHASLLLWTFRSLVFGLLFNILLLLIFRLLGHGSPLRMNVHVVKLAALCVAMAIRNDLALRR